MSLFIQQKNYPLGHPNSEANSRVLLESRSSSSYMFPPNLTETTLPRSVELTSTPAKLSTLLPTSRLPTSRKSSQKRPTPTAPPRKTAFSRKTASKDTTPPLVRTPPPIPSVRKISTPVMLPPKSPPPPLVSPLPIPQSNISLLPPPSSNNGISDPILGHALVAARKAVGFSTISPLIALPARPRPPPAPSTSSVRERSNPSRFSLPLPGRSSSEAPKRVIVNDSRWRFKREVDLPRPRLSRRTKKAYKSGGKGSNFPLDLRTLD